MAGMRAKLSAELGDGRLDMIVVLGRLFQDGLPGPAWGDWAQYTASSLRVFVHELGVQGPVGFWDPLGFSSDGNAERFHRRQTERKHVGISMLATMVLHRFRVHGQAPKLRLHARGHQVHKALTPWRIPPRYRLQVGLRSSRMRRSASCRSISRPALQVVLATLV